MHTVEDMCGNEALRRIGKFCTFVALDWAVEQPISKKIKTGSSAAEMVEVVHSLHERHIKQTRRVLIWHA